MGEVSGKLKALADETRLNLVKLLLAHDLCVGALAHNLGVSEAAVSQHLRLLKKHGLVKGEKRGYWTHYAVDREALVEMGECLKEMAGRETSDRGSCFKMQESNSGHCKNRR